MDSFCRGHQRTKAGRVGTIEDLAALYGEVAAPSIVKEVDHIHPVYRPFIEAAPFAVLATAGPGGLDATPRQGQPEYLAAHAGVGETLRVHGTAEIRADDDLLSRFAVAGQRPRTVLRITVSSVFFQCSRAVIRAGLWNPDSRIDRSHLPSVGTVFRALSEAAIDGEAYDQALPDRVANTLY